MNSRRKGFMFPFTARVIIGIVAATVILFAGSDIYSSVTNSPAEKSFSKLSKLAQHEEFEDGDIVSTSISLDESNVIIGFNSASDRVTYKENRPTYTRGGTISHSTYFKKPGSCNNQACLCLCQELERISDTDAAPFSLECESQLCISMDSIDFPDQVSCEEIYDKEVQYPDVTGAPQTIPCNYNLEGGFMVGSDTGRYFNDYPAVIESYTKTVYLEKADGNIVHFCLESPCIDDS